jgi:CRP-like cAMP-binding protein
VSAGLASTLEAVERQLEGARPDADTLTRVAELLARAGRRTESARLLRSLIEREASAGRLVRALSALKRLERLGASDDELVAGLARRVLESQPPAPAGAEAVAPPPDLAPVAPPAEPEAVAPPEPEAAAPPAEPESIASPEPEIADQPAPAGLADVAVEAPAEAPAAPPAESVDVAPTAVPAIEEALPGPAEAAAPLEAPVGDRPPEPATVATPSGQVEVVSPRPSGMAFRLRTVFRRLLSLDEGQPAPPEPQPAAEAAPEPALAAPAPEPAPVQAAVPVAAVDLATPVEPPATPALAQVEPEPAPVEAPVADVPAGPATVAPASTPAEPEAETDAPAVESAAGEAAEAPSAPADVETPVPAGEALAAEPVAVAAQEEVPVSELPTRSEARPEPESTPAEEAESTFAPEQGSGFFRSLWRRIVGDEERSEPAEAGAESAPVPTVAAQAAPPEAAAPELPTTAAPEPPTNAAPEPPTTAAPETAPEPAAPAAEAASDTAALESLFASPPEAPGQAAAEPPAPEAAAVPPPEEAFHGQLLDMIQDILHQPGSPLPEPEAPPHPEAQLIASALFAGLSDAELLSVIQGLELVTCEPGQVLFTEGEPGDSLFILTTGSVRAWIRNPIGHSVQVREMKEGDFFGEVAVLSGSPRSATLVVAAPAELFRLDRPTLDRISAAYPKVRATLEAAYQERTGSPEEKTIRQALVVDSTTEAKAEEVLRAYFGDRAWDPRMRLRLADLLLKSGKPQQALPILVELAEDLIREGFPEKAIAILKKIERIQGRPASEVPLSDLLEAEERQRRARRAAPAPEAPLQRRRGAPLQAFFQDWVVDLVRDALVRGREPHPAPGTRGLAASPLFADFSEDELLALIAGLRLSSCEPGEIIITEGEPGSSVLILASGAVRVFVRDPHGHDVEINRLAEGEFFGEMSALSGRPRSATVTAAARCELLELDRRALDSLAVSHPRVRAVLEETYIARADSSLAASARAGEPGPPG